MKQKVLFGLRDFTDKIQGQFEKQFAALNMDYEVDNAFSKLNIRKKIETDKQEIAVVILQWSLENANPYTADELVSLSEMREDIKFIIIFRKSSIDNEYLTKLLNANITNAVFEEEAKPSYITKLIESGRSRREARIYYGITSTVNEQSKEILVNGEIIAFDKAKTICKYITEDSEQTLKERLDHVLTRIKEEDFIVLLGYLDDSILKQIRELPDYEKYFVNEEQKLEKRGLKTLIPLNRGNGSSSNTELGGNVKPTIITKKRKIVGVLGMTRNAGTTFVAVNLAKQIANCDNSVVFMEIPRSKHFVYNDLNLKKHIGYSFVSVPNMIYNDELNITGINNIYEGINFYVADPTDDLPLWKTEHSTKLINSTNDTVVIDLGNDMNKVINQGIFNLLTDMVMVINYKDIENYVTPIRNTTSIISQSGVNGFVVFTGCKKNVNFEHELFRDFESSCLPLYNITDENLFLVKNNELQKVLQVLGFTYTANRNDSFQRTQVVVNKIGKMEIGITSIKAGIGKTHTSIMFANALRYQYRVCIVEQNSSGHFKQLSESLQCDITNQHFSYLGIDFYMDITYAEFSRKYRNQYDYIFIDYGELQNVISSRARLMEDFIRCDVNLILTYCTEWRIGEIIDIMPTISGYDEMKLWTFLVPYTRESQFKRLGLRDICEQRKIFSIPFSQNPVDDNPECKDLCYSLLGLPKETKRGLFKRKGSR